MSTFRSTETTSLRKDSMNHCRFWHAFLALALVFAWFGLAPMGQAVIPAPDGGYPNANTAEGFNALFSLDVTQGQANTAVGYKALYSTTTADFNTAVGDSALESNTTGGSNTAIGGLALEFNTTGRGNTAIGQAALSNNDTGNENTATGQGALYGNDSGGQNTATGVDALSQNDTGSSNTASGFRALYQNNGNGNTANGYQALYSNETGGGNTATGQGAMYTNSNGFGNTATGGGALYSNVSANDNTATGASALFNNKAEKNTATGRTALYSNILGTNNTANGYRALLNSTGNNNIAIGSQAGSGLTNGDNNIYLAALGINESNTIRIGRFGVHQTAYMQGVRGATVASGVTTIVGPDGHLGTIVSSARFKEEIEPMDKASEAILALKPVTFCYKKELDPDGIPQFGLVAEEVEKVNPDLVTRDEEGKLESVRYEAVNAMLLNEFLKEHRTVQEQGAIIARQQKQIDALTAGLQKVSAQLELSKPAPQVVNNP
jgi:hypothetical protein